MDYTELFDKASAAGFQVAQEIEPLGNGYVYVKFPGDQGFRKWLQAKEKITTKDPARGWVYVIDDQDPYGSVTKKEAYAEAFVKALRVGGVDAHAGSYLL